MSVSEQPAVVEPDPPAATTRRRRSRGWHPRRVRFAKVTSADGTRIETWSNVADGPTVLLCNALGANPYAWPQLLEPECGLHVVSWNHRGVGRSERPSDPTRVDTDAFVEDAVAVLDAHGIDRCVVIGWAYGVTTAFELARAHPERVAGLFAVAGVPGGAFASRGAPLWVPRPLRDPVAVRLARLVTLAGPVLTPVVRRVPMGPVSTTVLRYSGVLLPLARREDVRRAVREFLTTPVDWYGHLAVGAAGAPRVSPERVAAPAAFVSGRLDLLTSARDLRTVAERMDGASYVALFGTHLLPLERPHRVTQLLRDFVAGVEPR